MGVVLSIYGNLSFLDCRDSGAMKTSQVSRDACILSVAPLVSSLDLHFHSLRALSMFTVPVLRCLKHLETGVFYFLILWLLICRVLVSCHQLGNIVRNT